MFLVTSGYGHDESVPYAWRNVSWVFSEYSPRIRNPFRMHSRNVRNVFILCVLHIRRAKVWFLRHKSMVFGVQKPPFYIAKTPFLKYTKQRTRNNEVWYYI